MRGAERIVDAFGALGETRKAAALTQRTDAVAPPRENFMGISLMPDIPDEPVAWRVKDVVKCNCQFNDAETSAQMTTGDRYSRNRLLPQFVGQLLELCARKLPQIMRLANAIKQRRLCRLSRCWQIHILLPIMPAARWRTQPPLAEGRPFHQTNQGDRQPVLPTHPPANAPFLSPERRRLWACRDPHLFPRPSPFWPDHPQHPEDRRLSGTQDRDPGRTQITHCAQPGMHVQVSDPPRS